MKRLSWMTHDLRNESRSGEVIGDDGDGQKVEARQFPQTRFAAFTPPRRTGIPSHLCIRAFVILALLPSIYTILHLMAPQSSSSSTLSLTAAAAGAVTLATALLASSDDSLRRLSSRCVSSAIRKDSSTTLGYTLHPLELQFCIAMPFFSQTMEDVVAKALYALTLSVILAYSLRLSYLSLGTDLYGIATSCLSLIALMTLGIALGVGPMACFYTALVLVPAASTSRQIKPLMITPHGIILSHVLLIAVGTITLFADPSGSLWDRGATLLQYLPLLYLPVLGGRAAATPWVNKAYEGGKATKGQPVPVQPLGLHARLWPLAYAIAAVSAGAHLYGVATLLRSATAGGKTLQAVRWFWAGDYAGSLIALVLLVVVEKSRMDTISKDNTSWLALVGYAVVIGPGAAALLV